MARVKKTTTTKVIGRNIGKLTTTKRLQKLGLKPTPFVPIPRPILPGGKRLKPVKKRRS